jgi:succinate-semialdehyde dehydrogenase/glutarate-semialdehyde dehydrogenase
MEILYCLRCSIVPQCAAAIENYSKKQSSWNCIPIYLLAKMHQHWFLIKNKRGFKVVKSWCKYCHGSRKTFEKVVLELGGNDVFIILEDADMEKQLSGLL